MRAALKGLSRYFVTPQTAKHRVFAWVDTATLPSSSLIVFARPDDYMFGILQSRIHDLWSRGTGTQLREVESGFRYTPTTCFETFPLPRPTDQQRDRVGETARRLTDLRDGWLNPPGLDDTELQTRTLTNLHNQRPTWLANAHSELDAAVCDAYGWPVHITDREILERLLALNLERAAPEFPRP